MNQNIAKLLTHCGILILPFILRIHDLKSKNPMSFI